MILILSSKEEVQKSVEDVIDWIEYLGGNYLRVNGSDILSNSSFLFHLSMQNCGIDSPLLPIDQINTVWFRGFIRHRQLLKSIIDDIDASNDSISELKLRVIYELRLFTNFLFNKLKNTTQVPSLEAMKLSKIEVLEEAQKIGLVVPDTIITNSKKELLSFYFKYGKKIISKSLYETVFFEEKEKVFFFKTELINDMVLKKVSNTFFPSLFQQYIEKEFEIRAFFLENEFYCMAIFSQLDSKTMVDFRNYNNELPNRTVPYKLPKNVEVKIIKLMKILKLNTGSIDLIKSKSGEHVFLEVNPTGQFGMTSAPCNYNLEKIIAQKLINHDEKK